MKNASRISIAALCAAAALGLVGCNSPSSGTAPEVAPVQVQAQDLTPMQKAAGVYAGELPCADCSGIRTTLYLRANAHVVTLIQEALCSGDARCVVEAVEKACRLKGLPVPHELYGEMTLESLIAVMAAIGLDLRTERLN